MESTPKDAVMHTNESAVGPVVRRGAEERGEQEDYEIPRARLLQHTSEEVKDRNSNLKAGTIINSITKDILSEEFVVVFKMPSQYIRFNPRNEDSRGFDKEFAAGAMIYRTLDHNDPRVLRDREFGPKGESPLVTKFLNFFCLFPGATMPMVMSFSKTSFKGGKRLNTLIDVAGGDVFSRRYKLVVREAKDGDMSWYELGVESVGVASEEDFKRAETWYTDFYSKRRDLNVHEDVKPDEDVIDPATGKKLF